MTDYEIQEQNSEDYFNLQKANSECENTLKGNPSQEIDVLTGKYTERLVD